MEQQDRQGEYHDQTEDQVQVFLRLHFVLRRFGSSAGTGLRASAAIPTLPLAAGRARTQ